MPENPYSEDELKRRAQVGMLSDAPVSGTMPVGGGRSVMPMEPQRQTALAGNRQSPAMPGWDAGNWADPNMHSVKYDAGDFFYGKTKPTEIGSIVSSADFQKRFPGATFNGKDWVDFAGAKADGDSGEPVYGIDVLKGANTDTDTSDGVWWGAPDAQPTGPTPSAPRPSVGGLNPAADNSSLARIMAELNATVKDKPSPAEREAILMLMQGGI